jgi:hypothetical protein
LTDGFDDYFEGEWNESLVEIQHFVAGWLIPE